MGALVGLPLGLGLFLAGGRALVRRRVGARLVGAGDSVVAYRLMKRVARLPAEQRVLAVSALPARRWGRWLVQGR